jgi:hypothetical protein
VETGGQHDAVGLDVLPALGPKPVRSERFDLTGDKADVVALKRREIVVGQQDAAAAQRVIRCQLGRQVACLGRDMLAGFLGLPT